MKRNFFKFVLSFIFFLAPFSMIFAETNSGFLNDSVWFSKKSFVEGDSVDIHTAIWNSESATMTGNVEFLDGTVLLGTRSFSIEPNKLADISVKWRVTAGDHTIKVRIKDSFIKSGGVNTAVTLADREQELPKISVSKNLPESLNQNLDVASSLNETVKENLPENVAVPISNSVNSVEDFRTHTAGTIKEMLSNTNKKIENLKQENTKDTNKTENTKDSNPKSTGKKDMMSGVQRPIAYVELFLLSLASFIFKNSIVFYLICAILIFFVLRFVYRKIRR